MKSTTKLGILTAAILLSLACCAQSYERQGTMTFRPSASDAEAHITVNGQTFDSYCKTTDSSISCTDSAGAFYLTFANGNKTTYIGGMLSREHSCASCNPLSEVMLKLMTAKEQKFMYRVAAFQENPQFVQMCSTADSHLRSSIADACTEAARAHPYFCVPSGSSEACYRIFEVQTPSGELKTY